MRYNFNLLRFELFVDWVGLGKMLKDCWLTSSLAFSIILNNWVIMTC